MNGRAPLIPPTDADYAHRRATFSWDDAARELDGLPGGGLNIAHEAVDRHCAAGRGAHVAIVWLPRRAEPVSFTYEDLRQSTGRAADGLRSLVAGASPRVSTVLGRVPELYVAALGTLKAGGVYAPLFSAFGPEPIRQRLALGGIDVVVTTAAHYRRKIAPIRAEVPSLRHVVVVDGTDGLDGEGLVAWDELVDAGDPDTPATPTRPDDLALLHFTSGTTGTPKGAMHVHGAAVAHRASAAMALDLRPDDVYWCTADPGWVTGTSYGIIAPLVTGATSVIDEGDFDADRWYGIVDAHRVTVWYTAPTAVRMMMRVGLDAVRDHSLESLRVVASVGEPLNPEAVVWGTEAFGRPILDNWWQSETGAIMISNFTGTEVRAGSMGRPLPGIDVGLLARDDDGELVVDRGGHPVEIDEADMTGELAIRTGWPSMFRGYLDMAERYASCFVDGWYRSGDLARRDADGYLWFVGRGDDVIKTAGHLIGPFEVESVLIEHPAVSEAAVIGVPDETAGNIVKAFVALAPGVDAGDETVREIRGFARSRLGAAVAPREVSVVDGLPKTRSGKIMRRLLRARELGLPEGDTSTLETDTSATVDTSATAGNGGTR